MKRLLKENKWAVLSLLIAGITYMVMMLVTIPFIRSSMQGVEVFDLRPMGYTIEEGYEIINALSSETLDYYKSVQIPLDFIYPLSISIFFFIVLSKLTSGMGKIRLIRWSAFLIMLFDYLENIGVYYMLSNNVEDWMIRITSLFSVSKSLSTTAVIFFIIGFVVYKLGLKFIKGRK